VTHRSRTPRATRRFALYRLPAIHAYTIFLFATLTPYFISTSA